MLKCSYVTLDRGIGTIRKRSKGSKFFLYYYLNI